MRDIELPIEEAIRSMGGKVVTTRCAELDGHPPKFSRTQETSPLVIGEQLILDRTYGRVDL
jgi:hypothetical protein